MKTLPGIALLLGGAASAVAQTGSSPATMLDAAGNPVLPDPASRSGWIRVEVAVITDDSVASLNAEAWPPTPDVRYPGQWRWLTDLTEPTRLSEQFMGADVTVDELGSVTVTLPPPPPPEPEIDAVDLAAMGEDSPARESSGEPLAMGTAASPSIDPLTGRPEDALLTNAVPLESLGTRPADSAADPMPDDWLEPFAESGSLTDAAASLEASEDGANAEMAEETEAFTPPPEPIAFARRPATMLADGLRSLARSRGTPAVIEAAWVQPPGEKNLPIVLDTSGDVGLWPSVQGFVELRRGNDLRVGVNFWLNTAGDYLPEGFAMDPPPRAAQRITVLEAEPQALVGTELGPDQDFAIEGEVRPAGDSPADPSLTGTGLVTYVDPLTGLDTTGPAGAVETGTLSASGSWPYRHLIQVADTRSVPEEGVRYYDHPVLQVVVTWKELTWGEVWTLGEEDTALLAELAPPPEDAEPAAILPPSMINRQ